MKLLFDANLSRRIVGLLQDLFPGSSQLMLIGLAGETPDEVIWEFAKSAGFTVVTSDTDFIRLSAQRGAPPKLIFLDRMNYSTEIAADLIRRNAVVVSEFEKSTRNVLTSRRI